MLAVMGETAMQMNETIEPAADAAATEIPTPDAGATPRQRLPRRAELAQLLDAKLAEDSDAKETPRAPDAWLERRLRTFERQMGAIEARQSDVEKNARAMLQQAQETIKAMEGTIAELQARAEAAEAKAKA